MGVEPTNGFNRYRFQGERGANYLSNLPIAHIVAYVPYFRQVAAINQTETFPLIAGCG